MNIFTGIHRLYIHWNGLRYVFGIENDTTVITESFSPRRIELDYSIAIRALVSFSLNHEVYPHFP